MRVYGFGLLASLVLSSCCGCVVGFLMGLVPGLHVNNLAAVVLACSSLFLTFFSSLGGLLGVEDSALLVSAFLCATLVSHCFSEAVPNTYVGIPGDDAITVLPAHRLAKAGLGWAAVKSSADGSLAGAVLGAVVLIPVMLLMGSPVNLYSPIREVMGCLIILLSAGLILSDALLKGSVAAGGVDRLRRAGKISSLFMASGLLGLIVLDSDYFACDIPGCTSEFVRKSALLLPLFAGLFGLPTLLLSLHDSEDRGSRSSFGTKIPSSGDSRNHILSILGGILVGWIPGMTSGSSATLCSALSRKPAEEAVGVGDALRFIWLYSSISTAGAVLSVGALFTITRARSGVMEAVASFVSPQPLTSSVSDTLLPCAIVLSMLLSALLSHILTTCLRSRLKAASRHLCSRQLAICAALFVCALVAVLTGLRGTLLLVTACSLGMLPPRIGVRRIHMMGCLLVPIAASFMLD